MTPLESYIEAQRIMCLKKYNENYSSTWKYILDFYLKKFGGKYLLQCNYEISKLPIWNFLKLPCDVDSKIEEHILWKHILLKTKQFIIKDLSTKE